MTNTPQYAALLDRLNNKTLREVNLDLVGLDGNAFVLMGAFQRQARKEKWDPADVTTVLDECKSGDYDHLLQTLITVCDPRDDDDDEYADQADYDDDDEEHHAARYRDNSRPSSRF